MKTNLGKIRIPNLSEIAAPDTVGTQQLRTRDKVFETLGTFADAVMDSVEFAAETGGYVAGRTILATGRGIHSAAQGLMGTPYRHAA